MLAVLGYLTGEQRAQAKAHQDVKVTDEQDSKGVATGHLGGQDAQHEHGEGEIDQAVHQLQAHGQQAVLGYPLDGMIVGALAVEPAPQPVEHQQEEDNACHETAV